MSVLKLLTLKIKEIYFVEQVLLGKLIVFKISAFLAETLKTENYLQVLPCTNYKF